MSKNNFTKAQILLRIQHGLCIRNYILELPNWIWVHFQGGWMYFQTEISSVRMHYSRQNGYAVLFQYCNIFNKNMPSKLKYCNLPSKNIYHNRSIASTSARILNQQLKDVENIFKMNTPLKLTYFCSFSRELH
jgi:hypothetical protein